jgi:hypothetical protein
MALKQDSETTILRTLQVYRSRVACDGEAEAAATGDGGHAREAVGTAV